MAVICKTYSKFNALRFQFYKTLKTIIMKRADFLIMSCILAFTTLVFNSCEKSVDSGASGINYTLQTINHSSDLVGATAGAIQWTSPCIRDRNCF